MRCPYDLMAFSVASIDLWSHPHQRNSFRTCLRTPLFQRYLHGLDSGFCNSDQFLCPRSTKLAVTVAVLQLFLATFWLDSDLYCPHLAQKAWCN